MGWQELDFLRDAFAESSLADESRFVRYQGSKRNALSSHFCTTSASRMSQDALNWVNPDLIRTITQGKNAHLQPLMFESCGPDCLDAMPLEAPQVVEAQAVLALHADCSTDCSADQGSGALTVCADIHDGQNVQPPRHDGHRVFRTAVFSDLGG
jgi:hypothetical protein